MIQKHIQESVNKRARNPIIIHDDHNIKEMDDDDNIPHPLEYMEYGFWVPPRCASIGRVMLDCHIIFSTVFSICAIFLVFWLLQ